MSESKTRQEFGDRLARVGDDVLLAAPEFGTTPEWLVESNYSGEDFGGTYSAPSKAAALEALAVEMSTTSREGLSLDAARKKVDDCYAARLVRGEVCLRAGKIVAIDPRTDSPWILDFGNIAAGPSLDWVFQEGKASFGRDPDLQWHELTDRYSFPLGSWTWVPSQ